MKLKILLLTLLISALLTLLFSFYTYKKRRVNEQIIYNEIVELQELATARQKYKEIIYSKTVNDFLWLPLSKKEFLISIEYDVTAGIDIKKGYTVEHKSDYVLITLPKGEILSIDALDSSIKQYFVKERLSSINRDDYFVPINDSKKKILEGDEIEELLIQCEMNAAEVLKTLLRLTGIEVMVEFKDQPEGGTR